MSPWFDSKMDFYCRFGHENGEENNDDGATAQWRASIGFADYIDALRADPFASQSKKWFKAQVIEEDDSHRVKLSYEGLSSGFDTWVSRSSSDIAPVDSKAKAEDKWRNEIEVGMEVDCQDPQGKYFPATITNRRKKCNYPNDCKVRHTGEEFRVIYRVYRDNGSRTDKEGKKYEGWSESFDEWLPVNTSRMHPLGGCTPSCAVAA
jgi:hypothetical protein